MYDRLYELKTHLLKSKYPVNIINSAITKAAAMNQADLRTTTVKDDSEVLVFVSEYNPKNPNILQTLYSCMSLLYANPLMNAIFGNVKIINSKREPSSLRSLFTHSNFTSVKPIFGVKKCLKNFVLPAPPCMKLINIIFGGLVLFGRYVTLLTVTLKTVFMPLLVEVVLITISGKLLI